jgi:magnesium chelatase subunit D
VEEEDLSTAVRFVLLPRATQLPERGENRNEIETRREPADAGASADDLLFEALDTELPVDALPVNRGGFHRGRRGSGASGKQRGRIVRVTARKRAGSRVALAATLRAAAPHQLARAAFPVTAIQVAPCDLRFKECKQKTGALILFAVDASGSMAVNRIHQAKGAAIRLLREAYLNRDEVAIVSFRGSRAEVVLPPSRSVELARRALDALAVGGGTPLAAGLLAALEVARRRKRTEKRESLLVLLTDGSPNVAVGDGGRAGIWREIETACAALRDERVGALVLDTQQHAAKRDGAQRVAGLLGGRYIYLPRPDAGAVYEAVTAAVGALRP